MDKYYLTTSNNRIGNYYVVHKHLNGKLWYCITFTNDVAPIFNFSSYVHTDIEDLNDYLEEYNETLVYEGYYQEVIDRYQLLKV